jgi:hypothetical protein
VSTVVQNLPSSLVKPLVRRIDAERQKSVEADAVVAPIVAAAVPAADNERFARGIFITARSQNIPKFLRLFSIEQSHLDAVNRDRDRVAVIGIARLWGEYRSAVVKHALSVRAPYRSSRDA